MTHEEAKKMGATQGDKVRLSDKVKLTKEDLSKIGLVQLNTYKSKRRRKNEVYLEL